MKPIALTVCLLFAVGLVVSLHSSAALAGTVTDIDGNVYQTVTIGTQVWMAENLKVTHYRNGESIPNEVNGHDWSLLDTAEVGAFCNYDNNESAVATYGRIYNWYAATDSRNIAPDGWHVPTDAEWQTLVDYLGGAAVAGGAMKDTGVTLWRSPNDGATNSSGFAALPGGFRNGGGTFYDSSYAANFWSSTEYDANSAWRWNLIWSSTIVDRTNTHAKKVGFSIRCVNDSPDSDGDGIPDDVDNCPTIYNPLQEDLDSDAIGDSCDTDLDGDGYLNLNDICPTVYNPGQEDLDNDGIGDACDPDIDGDGLSNVDEAAIGSNPYSTDSDGDGVGDYSEVFAEGGSVSSPADTDSDGTPNVTDPDDDGDGVPTIAEDINIDGNPTNDDTDSDGIPNYLDYDDDGEAIPTLAEDINADGNPANDDSDSDGLADYLDYDDDGDSVPTIAEDINADGNPANDDTDNDGLPNYLDNDDDGDGILTLDEDTNGDGNPANDDIDSDGRPNYLDSDSDNDGVADRVDNCPYVANPGQADADSDNIGDVCDKCTDTDSDGFGNPGFAANTCTVDNCPLVSNPTQVDTDHDGIGDACESCCTGVTGNVNMTGIVDLSDLSALVSYLTGGGYVLTCSEEANVNSAGIVDLSDLSALVSYLTGGGYVLPNCP